MVCIWGPATADLHASRHVFFLVVFIIVLLYVLFYWFRK